MEPKEDNRVWRVILAARSARATRKARSKKMQVRRVAPPGQRRQAAAGEWPHTCRPPAILAQSPLLAARAGRMEPRRRSRRHRRRRLRRVGAYLHKFIH